MSQQLIKSLAERISQVPQNQRATTLVGGLSDHLIQLASRMKSPEDQKELQQFSQELKSSQQQLCGSIDQQR